MFDIVGVAVLVGLTVALGWLARRAWRSTRRVVKWVGATLCGLLALVVVTALVVALVGYYKLNQTYDNPVAQISVEVTPDLVARGEQFGQLCAGCHAADRSPPMEGDDFLGEDAPPIGVLGAESDAHPPR